VALERGVYTEDSLKERFIKVEKIARRVAGVGEEGGTLLSYGFSYLQSLLMVNLEVMNPPGSMKEVDMSKMSTMDLVTMAKLSLEQGDLVRAVKVMTQVKGEAGMVASDWVSEARLTLETMQAVQVMMLHSLATSCKHLPGL
jgi:mitofilin